MGKLSTVFADETRAYVQTQSTHVQRSDRSDFVTEARQELWDQMPFDFDEIRATVDRVLNKHLA
jgi:hypothetical protein